jgi:hypothetical protein
MGFGQPEIPQQTTQTVKYELTPEQQAFQSRAASWLTSQIGQPAPAYGGQLVAPLTPAEQANISGINQLAWTGMGPSSVALSTLGAEAAGNYLVNPLLAGLLSTTGEYARQNFWNVDIPRIMAPFIASGQYSFSSPMIADLIRNSQNFELGLANTLLSQALPAYEFERNLQAQAAMNLPTIGMGLLSSALGASGLERQVSQEALQAAYQDWLRQQAGVWQAVSLLPNLIGMNVGQSATTTAPPLYGPSPFSQILSLAMMYPVFRMIWNMPTMAV